MLAHYPVGPSTGCGGFVHVVPKEDDQIGIVRCHMPIGREISRLPVRAGGKCKPHAGELRVRGRGGARKPNRTLFAQCSEPIPVWTAGFESRDVDMDGMRPTAIRLCHAHSHDVAHALAVATSHRTDVGCDMPPRPSAARGSSASLVQRANPSGAGWPEATPSVKG
jgi:hypothetical protein